MEKFNKYSKKLFIIAIILIPICGVLTFLYYFRGRTYLKVNSKNEDTIIKMIEEDDTIKIKGKIKEIGNMQGLGEWLLFFKYVDGSEEEEIVDDGDLYDLYKYIKQNGSIEGTKGMIVKYTFYTSVGIVIIYGLYKICVYMNKMTDEQIKKEKL